MSTTSAPAAPPTVGPDWRRRGVRLFVALLVIGWSVAVTPHSLLPDERMAAAAKAALRPLGVAIGTWSMYSQTENVDNCWLTATVEPRSGPPIQWTSPMWSEVGGREKFYRFRDINYYNSLTRPLHATAAEDFAHYLGRELAPSGDAERVVLSIDGLRLVPPAEGGIPDRDEITWMLYSEPLATIEPQP